MQSNPELLEVTSSIGKQYPVCGNEPAIIPVTPFRAAKAYIVNSNRGKEYLVLAGSVEHENALLFGYQIKPLFEGLENE